jgi:hypothetical protein
MYVKHCGVIISIDKARWCKSCNKIYDVGPVPVLAAGELPHPLRLSATRTFIAFPKAPSLLLGLYHNPDLFEHMK